MSHMAMEMLRVKTGTRITHLPHKGAAPATVALLTGESQVAFVVMPVAAPHIAGNRLRGLGVADKVRSAVAPNVPTMIEAAWRITSRFSGTVCWHRRKRHRRFRTSVATNGLKR